MKTLLLTALLALILPMSALAHEYTVGDLFVKHPAVNATPKGAEVAAGYFSVTNKGTEADTLVSIDAPGITDTVEIHSMTMDDKGVMKMRELDAGVELPAGQTVQLAPSGIHVMFLKVKIPLVAGEKYPGTLHFAKAGNVDVFFAVEPLGTTPADHAGH
jgi:copper(I)-binding protein